MRELNAKEKDLLDRIENNPDLQPFFFRKAKGLHWFDSLYEKGFFSPKKNPRPVPSKEEGYVSIPTWPAAEYLVAASPQLSAPEYEEYALKFLEIIRHVTKYAKCNQYGNYHTWWQFSKIIGHLPAHLITTDDLDLIDYWFDDPYERGITVEELSKNWLQRLLLGDEHSIVLALTLIDKIFSVRFAKEMTEPYERKKALLRFDSWHAKKTVENVALLSGKRVGIRAPRIFESKLVAVLDELKNDSWSSIWRSAIEEHEQNHGADDCEDILIAACRDCLLGLVEHNQGSSAEYLRQLIDSQYQTLRRLAIYVIDQEFEKFYSLTDCVIVVQNFSANLRHELWNFLNHNYARFQDAQKKKTMEIIEALNVHDDDGRVEEGPTAYIRSAWLSAIKDADQETKHAYQQYVEITNTEPSHPDFSSYTSVGWGGRESPYPADELLALSTDELMEKINSYEDPGVFGRPGIEGLVKTFKEVVKSKANSFYLELEKSLDLDLAYVYEVIEAYRELWHEKSSIQWNDIWPKLLEYCFKVVVDKKFWSEENAKQRSNFVANRHWIVGSIARLIEEGTKSDKHAFDASLLPQAKGLLLILLSNQEGEELKIESDAVFVAINSPRGRCIEALINHSLRSCRLADKEHQEHSGAWQEYEGIYNDELHRSRIGEYEFATLVTNYLPNFLYMSGEWVYKNLDKIFDQSDHQKWLCAMQGYSYVGTVYQDVYRYLKAHGDFIRALEDEKLKDRVQERVIQNIIVSYLNDYETLDDSGSLISVLLKRAKLDELRQLIWFIWTLRDKDNSNLSDKVHELWPRLIQILDVRTREGRKLASSLCHWVAFIDEIDDHNRDWLLRIAPYAEEAYNSSSLLKGLARISRVQPLEAQRIWLSMLTSYSYDYPEESIREIFVNLVEAGPAGIRKAKEIVDAYISHGIERPSIWLREIMAKGTSA